MNEPLFLLDGFGLIYRSYFGMIKHPLTNSQGKNISALLGFFRILFSLQRQYTPRLLAVAMDSKEPSFRHLRYPSYKANRDTAPQDLHAQVPVIQEILEHLGVPILWAKGFEADDIIGTLAKQCQNEGRHCFLVSSDKDLMQLVGKGVSLLRPEKGGIFRELTSKEVLKEKGVHPHQIVDYLALVGDSADNIPGVSGIGEKTASALLQKWENLEAIYNNLDEAAQGSRREKLKAGQSDAIFSRELVLLCCDVPLSRTPEECVAFQGDNLVAAVRLREAEVFVLADELTKQEGVRPAQVPESPPGHYQAILSEADLKSWGEKIHESKILSLDTETDSLDPLQARLVGISLAVKAKEAAYIPLEAPDTRCLPRARVLAWLNEIFKDEQIKIIGQNFKYDRKVLAQAGVEVNGPWFDTMVAAWLLDVGKPVNMDALAERFLNYHTVHFSDVVPKGGNFAQVPLEKALRYAAEDADITLRLYEKLLPALEKDPQLLQLFREIEMPLIPLLVEMESRGILLDLPGIQSFGRELGQGIEKLEKEIYELVGRKFNISSSKQLQVVLFEERKLKPIKKMKTGWSTDNAVLVELVKEDPVPGKILQYRTLSKLKSTYVDALAKIINPNTGRIHTNYLQTGAATGRLASKDPNLQNIPGRDEYGRRIRQTFHSCEGHCFISSDYSQIELVVLAHISGDETLITAFHERQDVHQRTASLLFGVEADQVSPEQRRLAKTVNFGIMYGMSAFRLSNEMHISRVEAKNFIETYFATYSGIKAFIADSIAEAKAQGGVRTLYGRYRPVVGINSKNRIEKAAAERIAVNTRIQGTAADIMKIAMLRVWRRIKAEGQRAKMLLQVHDELLLETPMGEVPTIKTILKEEMTSAADLKVPLVVNVETSTTWGGLH